MTKILILLFIFPLTVLSQKEKLFILTNGNELSEKAHTEIINTPNFLNNYNHNIVDSLIENDTIFYTLNIEPKRKINYKNMFVSFDYKYIPYCEYDFAESQLFIDSLTQSNSVNYYLNRANILFEMSNYYYSKDSYDENHFKIKSSYTIYKNKEILIVTNWDKNYSVLIKTIEDTLFDKLQLFRKESNILKEPDPYFGIPYELMDQWTYIRTESSEFTFLSFDDLKKYYFELFKEIRNVSWKSSFNTLIEEKKYTKLEVYKEVMIKNHEHLKLPIHKIEYSEPSRMINEH